MPSTSKLVTMGVAACCLAAIAVIALRSETLRPANDPPRQAVGQTGAAPESAPVPSAQPSVEGPLQRAATAPIDQGISGIVVDEGQRPIAGADVHLCSLSHRSPFETMAAAERGAIERPAASATSAADGTFRIATNTIGEFDLYVVSAHTADDVRSHLVVSRGRWLDVGRITLPAGLVVSGVVRDATSHAAIGAATVTIARNGIGGPALPGREQGLQASTDSNGEYRFENATAGTFTISAVAAGHARSELLQQHVFADEENRLDFDLVAGGAIEGVVMDEHGQGIADAMVRAEPLAVDSAHPAVARSALSGLFSVAGLAEGDYRLRVGAEGFAMATVEPVFAGMPPQRITLARQAGIALRVRGSDGSIVEAYTVTARAAAGTENKTMPGGRTRQVEAADLNDGVYRFDGFDPGTYELEVEAAGWAKAFSAPCTVVDANAAPEMIVVLPVGGEVRGIVCDGDGRPVVGASIQSLPEGLVDNGATDMFRSLLVRRQSEAAVRTGADGSFALRHLAAGDYQLRLDHPAFPLHYEHGLNVADGAVADRGTIRLERGTGLAGTVTVAGAPVIEATVRITAMTAASAGASSMPAGAAVEAAVDGKGRWQLPRRLPAGSYRVAAWRPAPDNRFAESEDLERSRVEITIDVGTPELQVEVKLPVSTPDQPGGK